MLVLSRKNGESIICDDHIEIKVLNISGNRVKLGISAPCDVKVMRSEMHEHAELKQEFELEILTPWVG